MQVKMLSVFVPAVIVAYLVGAIPFGQIIAKLLHEPSVRLKAQAGTPQGERNAAAMRDLFDLG